MQNMDKIVDPVLFGQRIRRARERLRMSQDELAVRVSKDQRAISEYENGKRKLAATDLPAFAQVLEVPVLYFYQGEIEDEALDEALLFEFHRLSTAQAKQAAIDIVRTLSNLVG